MVVVVLVTAAVVMVVWWLWLRLWLIYVCLHWLVVVVGAVVAAVHPGSPTRFVAVVLLASHKFCFALGIYIHPDQGLHAFIGYQNFVGDLNKLIDELKGADASITAPRIKAFVDNRLAANHGRGPADAAGGVVSSEMAKAADDNASIRTGTRALVLYVRPYQSHTSITRFV